MRATVMYGAPTGSRRRRSSGPQTLSARGEEAIERARELTDGYAVHSVLECVGLEQSTQTAIEIARPGGAVGRVGVPQDETMPASQPAFYDNITVSGGPAPVCAFRAMDEREAIKVMVQA